MKYYVLSCWLKNLQSYICISLVFFFLFQLRYLTFTPTMHAFCLTLPLAYIFLYVSCVLNVSWSVKWWCCKTKTKNHVPPSNQQPTHSLLHRSSGTVMPPSGTIYCQNICGSSAAKLYAAGQVRDWSKTTTTNCVN